MWDGAQPTGVARCFLGCYRNVACRKIRYGFRQGGTSRVPEESEWLYSAVECESAEPLGLGWGFVREEQGGRYPSPGMLIDGGNSGDYREPDLTPRSQYLDERLAGTSAAKSWLLCRSSEPLLVWECIFRRDPSFFVQSYQPRSPEPSCEQLVQRDLDEIQQARSVEDVVSARE